MPDDNAWRLMELPADAVDPDAFCAAFARGDLGEVASLFALPAVRAVVAATNAYIVAHKPDDEVFELPVSGSRAPRYFYPWYYTRPPPGVLGGRRFVIGLAIENGHADVVRWLFAPERELEMGATLAVMLPLTVRFAMHTNNAEILEILLNSTWISRFYSMTKLQNGLDEMLRQGWDGCNADTLNILLSYGASVNRDDDVEINARIRRGRGREAALLESQGAFLC